MSQKRERERERERVRETDRQKERKRKKEIHSETVPKHNHLWKRRRKCFLIISGTQLLIAVAIVVGF